MANLTETKAPSFRYINLLENYSEEHLNNLGYYKGFPCAHGHVIRDMEQHWCYECAKKILSNVCGFDVNYLHKDYKTKYAKLWTQIKITFPDECWNIDTKGSKTPKRVCFPSYRSFYSKQKSENINIHKVIYQCAWGDVGSLVVTRVCSNVHCCNPLHMVSSWNRNYPPQQVHPLETEFKAEKLMLYNRQLHQKEGIRPVVERHYRQTITHPELVQNPDE